VVGIGRFGFFGDGGPALSAALAEPLGLGTDAAGDLLITDGLSWRVRDVNALLATAPGASASPSSLTFPSQVVNTTSAGKDVTLTNTGNVTALQITKVSTTGDFAQTNNCGSSLAAQGSCKITVTFTPTATGTRTGTLSIADSAGTQNVPLTGTATATADFSAAASAPNPGTVSPGGSSTSTITVTPESGFNQQVTLSCAVTPASAGAPGCSLKPTTVTPSGGAAQSTLTITTTAASASLKKPGREPGAFYAMWLLFPAILFSTAGMTTPKRKRMIALFLLITALAGIMFLVGCGGGSSSTGGGGGGGTGTPAGTYAITVTAKAGSITHTTQVSLTVQ